MSKKMSLAARQRVGADGDARQLEHAGRSSCAPRGRRCARWPIPPGSPSAPAHRRTARAPRCSPGSANTTWLITCATQRYSPLAKSSLARAMTAAAPPMYSTNFRRARRRQRIEVGGVGVVPAEIALVDRLDVVAEGAVVAAHVHRSPGPSAGRAPRRSRPAASPCSSAAASGRAGTCRGRAASSDRARLAAPHRPVVLGEHHVGLRREHRDASPRYLAQCADRAPGRRGSG